MRRTQYKRRLKALEKTIKRKTEGRYISEGWLPRCSLPNQGIIKLSRSLLKQTKGNVCLLFYCIMLSIV